MYDIFRPYSPKGTSHPVVFNCRDEHMHMQMKKPVAPLFSTTNIVKYEHHVDGVLELLFKQMDAKSEQQETTDLSKWLQYFAFEVGIS